MGEQSQGMGEGENPDLVPGTNVSGEPRQRSHQGESGGWGRGGAGGAGVLQGRLGPGTGTQGIRSLENGLAKESLDAGGWALGRRAKSNGERGLRRHTLSPFSI